MVTDIRELTSSADLRAVRWLAYGVVIPACGYAAYNVTEASLTAQLN